MFGDDSIGQQFSLTVKSGPKDIKGGHNICYLLNFHEFRYEHK